MSTGKDNKLEALLSTLVEKGEMTPFAASKIREHQVKTRDPISKREREILEELELGYERRFGRPPRSSIKGRRKA